MESILDIRQHYHAILDNHTREHTRLASLVVAMRFVEL